MLDKLYSFLDPDEGLEHFKNILYRTTELIDLFQNNYLKNPKSKNEAIDALIEIIKSYKNKEKDNADA